jgi:hypothetical protein
VFLEFQCDADLLTLSSTPEPDTISNFRSNKAPEFIQDICAYLIGTTWETTTGEEAEQQFDIMADQLPDTDVDSFIRNTKVILKRRQGVAYLTIGYFTESRIGRIRIRVRTDNNALLYQFSQSIADNLYKKFTQLKFSEMEMYQSRSNQYLLKGKSTETPGYKPFALENLSVLIPWLVSVIGLVGGGVWAWSHYSAQPDSDTFQLLGDYIWIWYGRLFGPLFMAFITSSAVWVRDWRHHRPQRTVQWDTANPETLRNRLPVA